MILDGWGIGQHGKGDVIFNTPTPYLDYLTAISAHSELAASGEDVGLPTDRWATQRWVTSISAPAAWSIRTWSRLTAPARTALS